MLFGISYLKISKMIVFEMAQQAAGNVMRGLPEETAADLTGTF